MRKSMYSKDGLSILTSCRACGRVRYCEQHGTTAQCGCSVEDTESDPIPYEYRMQFNGVVYIGPPRIPQSSKE